MEINFFSENLRYLRLRNGTTLVELGELFDLGKSQISLYENGKSYPPIPVARKICKHFNISMDDMFETDLRPEPPPQRKLTPITEGVELQRHVERELQEMDAGGVSMVSESPPPKAEKEEIHAMKKQMLEMMMKLEEMTQ